jgi:hypothetical protein
MFGQIPASSGCCGHPPHTVRRLTKKCAAAPNMILTGDGGDQLFLRMLRPLVAREIVKECSSLAHAEQAISGISFRQRSTFWRVAGEVISGRSDREVRRRLFGDLRFPPSPVATHGVGPETELVPGERDLVRLSTTRAFQYFGLRNAELNRLCFAERGVEERKAFLFWPLIKAALMAKRSHHCALGRDRAIVRSAFKEELPEVVCHRAGKGCGRDVLVQFDYAAIAGRLLDGPLRNSYNLLSPRRLEEAMRGVMDHDLAFAMVRAAAVSDWMDLYGVC